MAIETSSYKKSLRKQDRQRASYNLEKPAKKLETKTKCPVGEMQDFSLACL